MILMIKEEKSTVLKENLKRYNFHFLKSILMLLKKAKKTIFELQQIKKSEGLAILEIDHLRSDNQRLVKMLKTTKEVILFN